MSDVYKQHKPPASGGAFLKLEDGEQVKIRIATEPYIYINQFPGAKPTTRYAWKVWNHEAEEAQIFQQGVTGYRQVANLAQDEDWGNPTKYDLKVRREGTGTDTKYHFSPVPNSSTLTQEAIDALKKLDLVELVSKGGSTPIPLSEAVGGKEIPKPQQQAEAESNQASNYDFPEEDEVDTSDIPF